MKSMMKLIHIFSVIVFLLMLGVHGVLPVKADAPDQTITIVINAPSTAADGESFTVYAEADSGLTVTYSASGVCTNVGVTFTMTSASGTCTIQYNQAGDEIYDPAPQLTDQVIAQEHVTPTQRAPHTITTSAVETFYVSPNGNDANSCTNPNEACLTIPAAITKAADGEAGDTVYVATGTYTISNTIDEVLSIWIGITLSGGWNTDFTLQNDLSIIDGQNTVQGIWASCNTSEPITIDHFKIQNSLGPSIEHCGPLIINNSVISNNYSLGRGSAIFSDGDLTLNNTTVENNISVHNNGAIEVYVSHSLTINNSTITGNQGGGIVYNSSSNSPAQITNINNSTITNNTSKVGGGLIISDIFPTPVINIRNSIIAGNGADSGPDCSGTISVSDHNIIGNTSGCTINTNTGSKLNVNPAVSSYPTGQLHYRVLFSGSPAIDAGNPATCLLTDQRQISRKDGDGNGSTICDIGAYEYNPTPGPATSLTISSGSNQHAIPSTSFSQPLIVSVLDDEGTPVEGVTVTFTAPDSGPSGTFANSTNITSVNTNSNGLAITAFTANSELGSYNVSASAPGLSTVDFSLANIVWFVSPTGLDTNTCDSSSTPCLTINGAIAKATSGDSIYVAAGTYTGSGSQVVSIPQNMQILGGWDETFTTRNGKTIIDGQNTRDGIYIAGRVDLSQITVRNSFVGIENAGVSTLKQSALMNNHNAISNEGIITVINSTMSGNTTHAINNFGIVKIQYSTITNNKGSYAVSVNAGLMEIGDSILAGNPGGNCKAGKSNMKSKGYNIFGSSCESLGAPAFIPLNTDQTVTNLVIGPLTPSGYHLILAGSAPINHANPVTCASIATDQRGMVRPQGGQCDIGAYEYTLGSTPTTFIYSKGSNQNGLVGTPYTTLFEAFVLDDYGSPVKDVIVTFTAPPASSASGKFADTHTNTTTVVTNSSGMAVAPAFTPNNISGSYNVSATASGVASSVTFALKNLPIPVPILPANLVKDNTPTFKWWKISGATKYQYQLWKGSTLIYSRITSSSICSALTCQVTPATNLGFGNYKWKVQAMIGSVWQTYSAQQAFSIPFMAKAGLWDGAGMDFYINPSHTAVKNFAIYVYIGGCGIYKITYTLPLTITANKDFKFTGRFYATGTFDNETRAHGTLGLKSYYLKGCGYLTGGPFSWTATWKNSTQPTVIQAEVVPMPVGPQPDDSPSYFTVERVVGP